MLSGSRVHFAIPYGLGNCITDNLVPNKSQNMHHFPTLLLVQGMFSPFEQITVCYNMKQQGHYVQTVL